MGLWSDGDTMWVADRSNPKKIFAYDLESGDYKSDVSFTKLKASGNAEPRGIWATETTMHVVDKDDMRVYTYNMPDGD